MSKVLADLRENEAIIDCTIYLHYLSMRAMQLTVSKDNFDTYITNFIQGQPLRRKHVALGSLDHLKNPHQNYTQKLKGEPESWLGKIRYIPNVHAYRTVNYAMGGDGTANGFNLYGVSKNSKGEETYIGFNSFFFENGKPAPKTWEEVALHLHKGLVSLVEQDISVIGAPSDFADALRTLIAYKDDTEAYLAAMKEAQKKYDCRWQFNISEVNSILTLTSQT